MGLISIIAPVDCIEKPMDMEDKKKMHIRVRYLICLLFVLYFVLYIFGKKATMCRTSISCRVRVSYINYRINTKIFYKKHD